jgi:hypothetical protein
MEIMKKYHKDIEKIVWDHMVIGSKNSGIRRRIRKLMASFIALICITYVMYSLNLLLRNYPCLHPLNFIMNCTQVESLPMVLLNASIKVSNNSLKNSNNTIKKSIVVPNALVSYRNTEIDLKHILFGIASSANLWDRQTKYTKLWCRSMQTRGFVWLDEKVRPNKNDNKTDLSFPPLRISSTTSHLKYKNKQGHCSTLRVSRIISKTFRLGLLDVQWFVMGYDDTVFVLENLVTFLSKYDHMNCVSLCESMHLFIQFNNNANIFSLKFLYLIINTSNPL